MAEAMLPQRVVRLHDFKRTGAEITGNVAKVAEQVARLEQESDGNNFWWPQQSAPPNPRVTPFRWPASSTADRPVEDISLYKLADLAQRPEETPEETLREMAKSLGVKKNRTGPRKAAVASEAPEK